MSVSSLGHRNSNLRAFGRYRIDAELGHGAAATVYRARSANGELVALKVLNPEAAGVAEIRNALLREFRTLARLRHRSILHVHEMGEVNGRPYMSMAYINGETLAKLLNRNRKLGERATLDIARQLAAALDYLHGRHLIHRDIKPSNVLMTPDSRAILFDFGTAVEIGTLGDDRGIYGTPAYIAPEQILASSTIDGRADLYSLGIMLYQMLVGRRPFQGTRSELLEYHLHTPPPRPSEFGSVTPELEHIVLKLLEKKQADRFPDGAALVGMLDKVEPTENGLGNRLRRWFGSE